MNRTYKDQKNMKNKKNIIRERKKFIQEKVK